MNGSRTIRHDDSEKVTPQDREAVATAIRAYLAHRALPCSYLSRDVGVSASTISQFLKGTYKGDWQRLAIDLDLWLEVQMNRDAAPRVAEFVQTGVAREIALVASIAADLGGIGMAFGDSGIGKTLALRAIEAERPGSIYVSIEQVGTTAQAVIEAIGRAMKVNPGARYVSSRHWAEAIKARLRGTGRLLIVDQIHKLCGVDPQDRALFALCDLHDLTGAPQLWVGTTDLVGYLERGEGRGKQSLAQIRSRIVVCRDLHERSSDGGQGEPLFTIDDVRKVFARNKIRLAGDAARYLMKLANLPGSGGLRACINIVRMATKVFESRADGKAVSLSADALHAVMPMLATKRVMSRTQAQLRDEDRQGVMAMAG